MTKTRVKWIEKNMEFIGKNKLLLAALFAAAIFTAIPFSKAGILIMDDLWYQLKVAAGLKAYVDWARSSMEFQGRALGVPFVILRYVSLLITKDGVLFNIVTLFLSYGLLGLLTSRLTRSAGAGMLIFLISLVFMPNDWERTPFMAFHGVYGTVFSFYLISLILFHAYLQNGKKINLYVGMPLYFIALCTYETFIVYVVSYALVAWLHSGETLRKGYLNILKKIAPVIATTLAYLAVYFILREALPSRYSGNSAISFDVLAIFYANAKIIIDALPLKVIADSFRVYDMFDRQTGYNFFAEYVKAILTPAYFLKGIIVAAVAKYVLDRETENRRYGIFALAFFFFILTPGIIVSLTNWYRIRITINGLSRIPTTYFVFMGLMGFMVCAALWLKSKLGGESQKIFSLFAALSLMLCSIGMDYNNGVYAEFQHKSQEKWNAVNALMQTDYFKALPKRSVIYAPSLFEKVGGRGIGDDYWSEYFRVIGGKKITVQKELPADLSEVTNAYYLKFNQLYLEDVQYIEIAKISATRDDQLLGTEILIASKTADDDYYVIGSTLDVASGQTSAMKIVAASSTPPLSMRGYDILQMNDILFDLDSLFISGDWTAALTKKPADARGGVVGSNLLESKLESGFYAFENDSVWIAKEAVLYLNAANKKRLVLDAYAPKFLLPNGITILVNDRVLIQSALTSQNVHLEADLPPGEYQVVKITIMMDQSVTPSAAGINDDQRELGLYLLNLEFR